MFSSRSKTVHEKKKELKTKESKNKKAKAFEKLLCLRPNDLNASYCPIPTRHDFGKIQGILFIILITRFLDREIHVIARNLVSTAVQISKHQIDNIVTKIL